MKKYGVIYLFLLFVMFAGQGAAQATDNQSVSQRVENYLQNLTTLKARFVQTTYDGTQTKGTFYLNRPGKLRFEYDTPIEDFIVADGLFIYFYDAEMKQQSNAPIGSTLADFLLREDAKLGEDIVVTDVMDQEDFLMVTLTQSADPGAGSLLLGFDKNPMRLKGWRILDAQGLMTEIELTDLETDISLSKKLFHYYDPEKRKPQYN